MLFLPKKKRFTRRPYLSKLGIKKRYLLGFSLPKQALLKEVKILSPPSDCLFLKISKKKKERNLPIGSEKWFKE